MGKELHILPIALSHSKAVMLCLDRPAFGGQSGKRSPATSKLVNGLQTEGVMFTPQLVVSLPVFSLHGTIVF